MHGDLDLYSDDQSGTERYTPNKTLRKSPAVPVPAPPPPPLGGIPPSVPLLLGPDNTLTTCCFCNSLIKTAVRYTCTARTHIAAALWCTLCCMCCIPYGSNSAKNTDHFCPSCNRYLGTYRR